MSLKKKSTLQSKINYTYELKIMGNWKIDSLIYHQKKLKEKNIVFEFSDLKTDERGFIECLSISVIFPDFVKGSVSNCDDPIPLNQHKYALGFIRKDKLSKFGGFEIGYFTLQK